MKKKFICTVCGYVYEGEHAPEKCPMCGVPASKFKELAEDSAMQFVAEHEVGVAKGCDEEMIKDLNAHFNGECTEVGMYLAMSRQADREGYPEIAEAFKRYAFEEAEHASKFAELLGDCVWDTKTNLEKRMNAEAGACEDKARIAKRAKSLTSMLFTTLFMRWLATKLVMVVVSKVFTTVTSRSNFRTLHKNSLLSPAIFFRWWGIFGIKFFSEKVIIMGHPVR